ncbi:MAG TPA: sucrose-6-phosphate hydrolase [Phycisphaerae bacterium]|nr:sucrose-6-phosphate hydrolase [Phycisphaerae bacterium]
MGRAFAEEVAELEDTHRRACRAPIESLSASIESLCCNPLLAVGSGGSLTTATVAATLFRDMAYGFSSAITPLELANRRASLRAASVLIASAGGTNPDAIGALRTAAQNEARRVLALCTKAGSKLSVEATRFSNVDVQEFECAEHGDGFLATNSLWTSSVVLYRAFAAATGAKSKIPERLARIVGASRWNAFVKSISAEAAALWDSETVIVLYGAASYPAAVDLESKFTEAALCNVWIADYRHFAHGRHYWLAKRGERSSVIAFVAESDANLASRTLSEIPARVPQLRIDLADNPSALLTALAHVFPIVVSAGRAFDIDPGRPGVPAFGRRIYHVNAYGRIAAKRNGTPKAQTAAIERKVAAPIAIIQSEADVAAWHDAIDAFLKRLRSGRFRAVVFDYDGTLCRASERFTGMSKIVAAELTRLLRSGIHIGIATGRGKSVREALRDSLAKKYWSLVTVGYYNGGQIGSLMQDDLPDGTPAVLECLKPVLAALKKERRLMELATVDGRLKQITISPKRRRQVQECWSIAVHHANLAAPGMVKFVRSSHSFDLLPSSVTKLDVIHQVQPDRGEVLAIGDMGRWPGNDCELLSHPYSLSVDEVSPDPSTCWNLAPPGVRGVDAMVGYFQCMKVDTKGQLRMRLFGRQGGRR